MVVADSALRLSPRTGTASARAWRHWHWHWLTDWKVKILCQLSLSVSVSSHLSRIHGQCHGHGMSLTLPHGHGHWHGPHGRHSMVMANRCIHTYTLVTLQLLTQWVSQVRSGYSLQLSSLTDNSHQTRFSFVVWGHSTHQHHVWHVHQSSPRMPFLLHTSNRIINQQSAKKRTIHNSKLLQSISWVTWSASHGTRNIVMNPDPCKRHLAHLALYQAGPLLSVAWPFSSKILYIPEFPTATTDHHLITFCKIYSRKFFFSITSFNNGIDLLCL